MVAVAGKRMERSVGSKLQLVNVALAIPMYDVSGKCNPEMEASRWLREKSQVGFKVALVSFDGFDASGTNDRMLPVWTCKKKLPGPVSSKRVSRCASYTVEEANKMIILCVVKGSAFLVKLLAFPEMKHESKLIMIIGSCWKRDEAKGTI